VTLLENHTPLDVSRGFTSLLLEQEGISIRNSGCCIYWLILTLQYWRLKSQYTSWNILHF